MISRVLALIPARSGSKSIPHKNLRQIAGRALLERAVDLALAADSVDRVVVSTDSEAYAEVARRAGADVPFLRPAELATDEASDLEVFVHALSALAAEGYEPELCAHMRPTAPVVSPSDIDGAIEMLRRDQSLDSVRGVTRAEPTPYKMWRIEDGVLRPLLTDVPEAHNLPRQVLPPVYVQTASVDVVRASVITGKGSMTGDRIGAYEMDGLFDIDEEQDFLRAQGVLLGRAAVAGALRLCFDIDGVIASITPANDYASAAPLKDNIDAINALFERGHTIVLNTARGSMTGIDHRDLTVRQLGDWGVRYHELHFGKPAADYYIDDRMCDPSMLQAMARAGSDVGPDGR